MNFENFYSQYFCLKLFFLKSLIFKEEVEIIKKNKSHKINRFHLVNDFVENIYEYGSFEELSVMNDQAKIVYIPLYDENSEVLNNKFSVIANPAYLEAINGIDELFMASKESSPFANTILLDDAIMKKYNINDDIEIVINFFGNKNAGLSTRCISDLKLISSLLGTHLHLFEESSEEIFSLAYTFLKECNEPFDLDIELVVYQDEIGVFVNDCQNKFLMAISLILLKHSLDVS